MRYFLDTEFDGFGGDLISLALVRHPRDSLYLILSREASNGWVVANVLPFLDAVPGYVRVIEAHQRVASAEIAEFIGTDPAPVIISDWPADIRYFCQLIESPGGEMAPIRPVQPLTFELHRVDSYPTSLPKAVRHNAWWDAMALRHCLTLLDRPVL